MSKRQNGEGTIFQRKSGLWCAELTIGYEGRKRIKKSLSSMDREELLKKVNEERRKLGLGLPVLLESNSVTVEEWLDEWLKNYKEASLRAKTIDLYKTVIEKHVKPAIGKIKLSKLNAAQIQGIYNGLAKEGKYNMAGKTNVVLSQALTMALKVNLVPANPNTACVVPKKAQAKIAAMSKEEQALFENACRDNVYGRALLFLLQTGLRVGELIALMWEDYDEDSGTISVNKTAVRVSAPTGNKNKTEVMVNPPKTQTGERVIPLSKRAIDIMGKQKNDESKNTIIFSSAAGTMLDERNLRREIANIASATKIKTHLTLHVLRHTFATRMAEKGANVKALSKILGHSTIQMTLDVYTDIKKDFIKDTMSLLDDNECGNSTVTGKGDIAQSQSNSSD
ncbi:MAG: site-specific integrase [Oscillospiraceae bacterium]|nr:site-specific integrase [Oscillospiraceae bacterium]